MRRALIGVAAVALLPAFQACDFGVGADDPGIVTSSLYGGGPAVSGSLPAAGQSDGTQGPATSAQSSPDEDLPVPAAVPGGDGCIYLVGGKLVIVPCPGRYDTGERSHGDPQPWSPGPAGSLPPMD